MGRKLNLEYREHRAQVRTFRVCPWCGKRSQFGHAKCSEDMKIASMLAEHGFPQLSRHDLGHLRKIKNEKTFYEGWLQDTSKPLIQIHRESEFFSWCGLSDAGKAYFVVWSQVKKSLKQQAERSWLDDLPDLL